MVTLLLKTNLPPNDFAQLQQVVCSASQYLPLKLLAIQRQGSAVSSAPGAGWCNHITMPISFSLQTMGLSLWTAGWAVFIAFATAENNHKFAEAAELSFGPALKHI